MPHRKLLYVVADGAVARLIERAPETGAFVTRRTLDGRGALEGLRVQERDEQPGRSMESANSAHHAVGREDVYRRAKDAFVRHTAEAVKELLAHGAFGGVVLAAPRRLAPVFRAELEGHASVVEVVAKDLTKTPDHELGRWLDPAALRAHPAP